MADRFEEEAREVLSFDWLPDLGQDSEGVVLLRAVADALRKAEARSLRMAAVLAAMPGRDWRLAERLNREAEKLERGE